jgi:hypothetical protein
MEDECVKEIYSFEILSSTEWNYPHPRSLEGINLNAKYQGMRIGKKYVEAFKSVRVLK